MFTNEEGRVPTIHGEKKFNFAQGAARILSEEAKAIQREEASRTERNQLAFERETARLGTPHKITERAEREDAVAERSQAGVKALAISLAEITLESIPLDGSPLLSGRYRAAIRERLCEFFLGLAAQGTIDPVQGSPGEHLVEECGAAAREHGDAEVASIEATSAALGSLEVSETVKKKVLEAVAAEKIASAMRVQEKNRRLQEGLPQVAPRATLFGSLAVKAARDSGVVNPEMALAEAVCCYTAIEVLHTLGLSRMTPSRARALTESARVSPKKKSVAKAGGAVPVHESSGVEPLDKRWEGAVQMTLAEEARGFRSVCAWGDPSRPEGSRGAWKLPHHNARTGQANFTGVRLAMESLLEGSAGVPAADRRAVYDHLAAHYREFEKEPPEFR